MIEKWHSRFETMGHGHPIGLGQHFADQRRFHVSIELAYELSVPGASSR